MGKHQKTTPADEAQLRAKRIINNIPILSRWLALMRGVQIIQKREEAENNMLRQYGGRSSNKNRKIDIDYAEGEGGADLDGMMLVKYVNQKAPEIEDYLIKENKSPFFIN